MKKEQAGIIQIKMNRNKYESFGQKNENWCKK